MRWRAIGTEQLPDLAVGVEALKVPKGVIPDILVASCGVQKLPANVKLMVGLHGLCVASANLSKRMVVNHGAWHSRKQQMSNEVFLHLLDCKQNRRKHLML